MGPQPYPKLGSSSSGCSTWGFLQVNSHARRTPDISPLYGGFHYLTYVLSTTNPVGYFNDLGGDVCLET